MVHCSLNIMNSILSYWGDKTMSMLSMLKVTINVRKLRKHMTVMCMMVTSLSNKIWEKRIVNVLSEMCGESN